MKITIEMIQMCYSYGKLYYLNEIRLKKAKQEIHNKTKMNMNSCHDYVTNFKKMLQGKRFTRYMSEMGYKYYLNQIRIDFSHKDFMNALNSFHKHIEYKEKTSHCIAHMDREIFLFFINKENYNESYTC